MIRVLLADDHEIVRHALKLLIDSQVDMTVVGEAPNGRLTVELTRALQPSVVVLDVSMPDMNGLEAARAITAASLGVAMVALTRHDDDEYMQALLKAGATAYVLKQSPSPELLAAIRGAADGKRYIEPGRIGRRNAARSEQPRVSDRETEVLRLIATGHSNKEIAGELNLSVKTVEVHKANAMRKLELRGRVDVVKYAMARGWLRNA